MKSKKIIALVLTASLINSTTNVGVLVKATEKAIGNINIQKQQQKSKLESNVINIFGTNDKEADFKVGFDDIKKEFVVYDQTSNILDKNYKNKKFWSIKIFDSTGKEKKYIELKGDDYANSNKLDELKGFSYEYGDFIELWHIESSYKQKINGNVLDVFDKNYMRNDFFKFEITKEGLKVTPTYKNLENTIIRIKGDWWKTHDEFIIRFDNKENKLKLTNRGTWYSYKSIGYEKFCTIQIFRKNKGEVFKAELNGYDTGQSAKLNELNDFKYEYGDVIKIWHKDFENQIITGHTINATENYNLYRNKKMDIKEIEKLGFEITENGLKQLYNEAPIILAPDYLKLNIGDNFNLDEFKKTFKASDDLDQDVSSTINWQTLECETKDIKINEEFINNGIINTEYPSIYKIRFKAKDSWEKEGAHLTVIEVKSKLEENKISVLGYDNVRAFTLGFNANTKELKIENQQNSAIHDYKTIVDKNYFTIKILDKNNNEKAHVELKGGDFGTSEKLNILKGLNYEYGDILIFNHMEKGRFRIDGEIIDAKENYADGVENDKNLYNTVFEITKDGLKAIYNEPPVLKGIEDVVHRKISKEDIDSFQAEIYRGNITAIDDKEGDITEKIEIEGYINWQELGEYNLKYFVYDKLGGYAERYRKLTIVEPSKIEKNFIRVDGFGNWGQRDKFKIGFDDLKKNIKIFDEKDVRVHETLGNNNYFKIQFFDKKGVEKNSLTMQASDWVKGGKLDLLRKVKYEYGDLIKLWHAEPTKLHIKGEVIDATNDYSNEITGVNRNDLILEITGNGLKEVEVIAPTIGGTEDLIIRKGQEINLLYGVTCKDSREGDITSRIRIENNNLNINKLGEYNVEYVVSNSLGKETRVNRKVKVVEVPKVEKNKINVLGLNSTLYFTIGFDDLNKYFQVFNQYDNQIHIYYKPQSEAYFSIKVLDKNMGEKLSLGLIGKDKGTSNKLDLLKNLKYEYGDFIKIYHKEPSNRLKIEGNIIDAKEDYNDAIQNRENIDNTIFEITEDGLKAVYNEAPVINGVENIKIRKDSTFDLKSGITVIDDLEGDITSKLIVKGNVDTSKIGDYRIIYEVTDSLGRKTTVERIITVIEIPILEKNSIEILGYNSSWTIDKKIVYNDKKFKIIFDDIKHSFRVYATTSSEIYKYEPYKNSKYIEIKLIDKNGKEKVTQSFLGKDHTFFSNKLSKFFNVDYEYGDIFKIYHVEPGKLRIMGNIINGKEDYSDGINNINNVNDIENIGFEITENGLKYIYNNKPEIKGVRDVTIRKGEAFNKLEGITAIDDRDGDITSKINVTGDLDVNKVGEYAVQYIVEDSWGRQSRAIANIKVIEKPKLENNFIIIKGRYVGKVGEEKLRISFDDVKKQFKLDRRIDYRIHDGYGNNPYSTIKILNKNRNEKLSINLEGNDKGTSEKLNSLNGYNYEYGDRIKLWHAESNRLDINGEVIDAKIDYSQRVWFDTNAVEFEITENGLKAIYNEAPVITGAENKTIKIGEDFDSLENITVKDDKDKNLVPVVKGNVDVDKLGNYELTYFIRDSWGAEQTLKRVITVRSNNKPSITGVDKKIINVGESFNLMDGITANDVEDNDLTSSIKVKGTVNTNLVGTYPIIYTVTDSDGNKVNVKRVIVVKSNDKPVIIGNQNITIKVGDTFDPLFEVEARDTEDGDLTESIKIKGAVNTAIKGSYDLVYSITDEDGNEATATRRVIVRSNDIPVIQGISNSIIKIGESFDKLQGITAIDTEDRDLTSKILVEGDVNISKAGIYKLIYSVTDTDGNKVSKVRTIAVKSNNKPVIQGINNITIKAGDDFEPKEDVSANDIEDGDLTEDIKIDNKVDNSNIGEYEVVYSVTDSDGNTTIEKRMVTVRSNEKPVIEGINKLILKVGDSFNDMEGIVAKDNEDGDLTQSIKITGTVDTSIEGVNTLVYTVIDSDGNETSIKRHVTIRSNNKPTIFGAEDITIKAGDVFDNMADLTAYDEEDGEITDSIKVEGSVNNNVVGTYNLIYKVVDEDGNEVSKNRTVTVRSNTEPKIEGVNLVTIKLGDTFDAMSGISAVDNEDGDITSKIQVVGVVDVNVIGKYDLTYSVKDSDGNKKIIKRSVRVRSNNKPIIKGIEDIELKLGDIFNPLHKVIAHDTEDGDLTNIIEVQNNVNVSQIGEYEVIYSVKDLDKNITTIIRKVRVRSNDKPIINGVDRLTIKVGDIFDPMNEVSAIDTEDGDMSKLIKVDNKVDTSKAGTYDVTYSVIDKDGNKTILTRKIKVRSNNKPRFEGIENKVIKVGDDFDTLFGISAHDTEDGEISELINVKGNVDNSQVGEYDLIYSIEDKDGNKTVTTRRITVRSNNKPVIIGADNLVIKNGDNFDKLLGVTATDIEDGELTTSIIVKGEVDVSTPGIYHLIYSVTDNDYNKTILTRTITVRSNEKPQLQGVEDISIKIGEAFNSKEGVRAIDLEDNDLTQNIVINGNVDVNNVGVYELGYIVKDSDNNEISATRRVTVRSNDKPVITGIEDTSIKINDEFQAFNGVSATDTEDNDLTSSIKLEGSVDITTEGKYVLTYSVEDSDGNRISASRTVTVRTNNKPNLTGVEDTTIKLGDAFDKLIGIEAIDNEDGEINHLIKIEGDVNTNSIGTNNLVYSVTDSDGNTITATRVITVRSNDKPIILGANNKIIKVGEAFNKSEGVIASDTEDNDLTNSIILKGNVDINKIGKYVLDYLVEDSDGNKTVVSRVITVRSNDKPVITGADDITIKLGDSFDYIDGVIVTDTEDGDITDLLEVEGDIDTSQVGTYNLIYKAIDEDGNETRKIRVIKVRSNNKPVISGVNQINLKVGDNFEKLNGVVATDIEDGDITNKIIVEGEVDTTKAAAYSIFYSVIDSDGNKVRVKRRVIVRTNTKPVIDIDDVIIKIGETLDYRAGLVAKDTEDGDLTQIVNIAGDVDNTKVGIYDLTYSVTDKDGNTTNFIRKVTVRTNDIPIVEGVNDVTIKVNEYFNPMFGVIANDTEDGDLTGVLNINGNFDITNAGKYNLVYSVIDSDGNLVKKTRRIFVRTNNNPIINGVINTDIKIGDTFDKLKGITAIDTEDGDLTGAIKILGDLDTSKAGIYELVYLVEDSDGNENSIKRQVRVRTNEQPIIYGIEDISIKLGEDFDKLKGVTAIDTEDGDLTSTIIVSGNIDTNIEGVYNLDYLVKDKDNNETVITRVVTVKTDTKPVIKGVEDITVKLGDVFQRTAGVIATDKEDGSITNLLKVEGKVNTDVLGEYDVTYSVQDSDGNIIKIIRKVIVRSNNKPEILGLNNVQLKVGDNFNPLEGITARDSEDLDLTNKIIVEGNIDTSIADVYRLNYSVTDSDGNKVVSTRLVEVKTNEKPIFLNVANSNIKAGETFELISGEVALDPEDGDISEKIKCTGTVDVNTPGTYELTYSVIDSDGNEAIAKRVVTVLSNENPVISGTEELIIKVGDKFNPMEGVSAIDAEDGVINNLINIKGKVDTSSTGIYKLIYSVTDSDGNITSVNREVRVRSNEKPIILGADDMTIALGYPFDKFISINANDREDGDLTSLVSIIGDIDVNKIGVYNLTYSVTDDDGNTTSVNRAITVRSNEKPVIEGAKNTTIKIGDSFDIMQSVTAIDAEDKDLTGLLVVKGNVDTSTLGTYNLIYTVTDSDNNTTAVTRNITVRSNDKPIISGITDKVIKIGDNFNKMLGIVAKDKEDGEITNRIIIDGDLDSNNLGEYELNYSVIDDDGNKEIKTRKITVRSNDKPIIVGVNNITIKVGDVFNPMEGIIATDTEDKDITNLIKLNGSVDTTKEGKYNLTYLVVDSDGNKSVVNRIVGVRSNEKPTIIGAKDVTIKLGDSFDERERIIAKDNEDGNITKNINIKGKVDSNTLGKYELVYSVADKDGNVSEVVRNVTVRSNDAPKLLGIKNTIIKVGEQIDLRAGITAIDNEDNDLSKSINIIENFNNNVPGVYEVIYSVTDSDENTTTMKKLIIVESNYKPIISGVENATIKIGDNFDPMDGVVVIDEEDGDLTNKNTYFQGKVDTNKVGDYELKYYSQDSDGNKVEAIRLITVRSNDKPTILNAQDIRIKVYNEFDPKLGIKIIDTEDKNIEDNLQIMGTVDTKTPGTYKVTYSVIDSDGNETSIDREVIVESNDKPIITGNDDITIKVGDNFEYLADIIAMDTEDGDLSSKVKVSGEVDSNKEGKYNLQYEVTDSDGNKTIATKTLTVRSNKKPVIIGANNIVLKVGSNFNSLDSVVVKDEEDGDITSKLQVLGNVDLNEIGKYILTYSVKDSDGNKTKLTRIVRVRSNDKPIITGIMDETIVVGSTFDPLDGIMGEDTEDGDLTELITVEGIVDTNTIGKYELRYSVKDSDGNAIVLNKVVTVRSNEKPIIKGADIITLKVGDNFNPKANVIATDKEDGDLSNLITILGNVDTSKVGNYDLVYSIKDSDGNSDIVKRRVRVRSNEKPIFKGVEDITIKIGDDFDSLIYVTALDEEEGDISEKIKVNGEVDTNTIGKYELNYSVVDEDGNEVISKRTITVRSNEKPIITGANKLSIKVGDSFDNKLGVVAKDLEDGDITNLINITGEVNTLIPDEYKLIYSVIDSDGNITSIPRIIKVRSNENPLLTGVDNITIKAGDNFDNMANIIAYDKEDGDLSELIEVIGEVNTNILGDYELTYKITDDDDNVVTAKRIVTVRSNDVPIIKGIDDMNLKQGDVFNPMLNVEAVDTEDGNLTDKITIIGDVDTSNVGIHSLTYSVIDSDDNETIVKRKIRITSNEKPEIKGVDKAIIKVGENFDPMENVEAIDLEDGDISNLVSVIGIVDNRLQGNYPLIYSVKDSDGNITSITRTITVKSNDAPIILGIEDTYVTLGGKFDLMAGVSAKTVEGYDITRNIEIIGFVDTTKTGTYKIIYLVSDVKGNKIVLTRNIIVENPQEPIIIGVEDIIVNLNYEFDSMVGIEVSNLKEGQSITSVEVLGTVDTSVEGDYNLVYVFTDNEGNNFTATRVITVTSEDSLILSGAEDITLRVGDEFNPMFGVILNNYKGEDLTEDLKVTGAVNTNIPGIYRLVYSALDKQGKLRATTRDIKIVDKDAPIIYGINDLILNFGDKFDPLLGVTASRYNSGDLNEKIKVIGKVDTTSPGIYNLIYSVTNMSGKVTTVTRNIEVKNQNGNLITGVENIVLRQGDSFDPMAGVKANYKNSEEVTKLIKVIGKVDTNKTGKYKLIYSLTDKKGIKAVVSRSILVKSDKESLIQGIDDIEVNVGDEFNPMLGVIAKDKENKDLTNLIKVEGNVDVNKPGKYNLVYSLIDEYGVKIQSIRTILVTTTNSPKLIGTEDIIVNNIEEFKPMEGIIARDNKGNDITDKVKLKGMVDNKNGNYSVQYAITDEEGNELEVNRVISVEDHKKQEVNEDESILYDANGKAKVEKLVPHDKKPKPLSLIGLVLMAIGNFLRRKKD